MPKRYPLFLVLLVLLCFSYLHIGFMIARKHQQRREHLYSAQQNKSVVIRATRVIRASVAKKMYW